ncbi:ornithine carbamoyltransferase [Candidatus Carsonella ruddii]|uniref:Ornithine carbamoyltransferase n=1 Tax=Candidatus Carsonella ruddii (Diaphorina cf. continua) TaxID=2661587 RepID=A0A7R6VZF6_CARRU|nr:hypothetical protein [Candidatus Carsonella ruddii (Diaphorina cf. continua)]BCG49228.1 ornithine carbamoyltransferase [Candidatus Carsonella ruddii (Diaphorina cf. continua)]
MNFYNKHLLNDFNLKKYELLTILELKRKNFLFFFKEKICIINEKQSLRTVNSLINVLNFFNIKFSIINNKHNFKKENIKDFSRTIGILYNYIFYRGNNDIILKIIAKFSGSVVINLLSNNFHPIQSISDISNLINQKIIYFFGNFNSNVIKSTIINLSKLDKILIIFSPKIYWKPNFFKKIFSNNRIIITEKLIITNKKCSFYNDTWVSMNETIFEKKLSKLINYQLNRKIFHYLKINKIFHCLPSYNNNKFISSEIDNFSFESKFTFFEKQIIDKIRVLNSYFILNKKSFFKVF